MSGARRGRPSASVTALATLQREGWVVLTEDEAARVRRALAELALDALTGDSIDQESLRRDIKEARDVARTLLTPENGRGA